MRDRALHHQFAYKKSENESQEGWATPVLEPGRAKTRNMAHSSKEHELWNRAIWGEATLLLNSSPLASISSQVITEF